MCLLEFIGPRNEERKSNPGGVETRCIAMKKEEEEEEEGRKDICDAIYYKYCL